MTKKDFFQKACLAFATNTKVLSDPLTADQCLNNITGLAEGLTDKVESIFNFDPE